MPRLPKINAEQAVSAAQGLFWKYGYQGLGTRKLEDETGITRFSLQTNHGGKKTLFLKTLDAYCEYFETEFLPKTGDDPLENLAAWFEARANPELAPESGRYGCLMLNCAVEFQGQDEEVNLRTTRFTQVFQNSFRLILKSAIESQSLAKHFDVESNVRILHGLALSLNVVIRAAENNAAGIPLAKATAKMIRAWKTD